MVREKNRVRTDFLLEQVRQLVHLVVFRVVARGHNKVGRIAAISLLFVLQPARAAMVNRSRCIGMNEGRPGQKQEKGKEAQTFGRSQIDELTMSSPRNHDRGL